MSDVESSIDESLNHEERACRALEAIADALTMYAKIEAQRYEKEYPVKTPTDATITKVKSADDLLRESLGGDGDQSTEDWLDEDPADLGPRERELLKKGK